MKRKFVALHLVEYLTGACDRNTILIHHPGGILPIYNHVATAILPRTIGNDGESSGLDYLTTLDDLIYAIRKIDNISIAGRIVQTTRDLSRDMSKLPSTRNGARIPNGGCTIITMLFASSGYQ